jgi:hypothetical protein
MLPSYLYVAALVLAQDDGLNRLKDEDLIAPVVFEHIRFDVAARTVEFDATVPIRLDDPRAPRVYLEQLVCIPDTKEHEVVLVTSAKPSHVHAALLAVGLQPGKPATWKQEGVKMVPIAPEGDAVKIELIYTNAAGERVTDAPSKWVKNAATGEAWPSGDWVFAGSVMVMRQGRDIYEADAGGTLIGLTSFGTEVLAWPKVISPDSQQQEPEWIADAARVPPMGTKVVVRLSAPGG